MENIVIGIEGPVGSGKTSICRELIKRIPNTILLNGGNLYRAIVYCMMTHKEEIDAMKKNVKDIDIKQVMDYFNIEIRIEDNESTFYIKDQKMSEDKLQSEQASMQVSVVGGMANNSTLFKFARNLIDNLKTQYNVIVSGRSVMEIYPDIDYHFFVTANLEERINRKYIQYKGEISKEKIKEDIEKRDELQEKAGFYKIYPKTTVVDVTECKNVDESTRKILEKLKLYVNA